MRTVDIFGRAATWRAATAAALICAAAPGPVLHSCRADILTVPYDPQTMQFEVTPVQAIATCRSFAGNPSLNPALTAVEQDTDLFAGDYYLLDVGSTDRFKVNAHTGTLWQWKNRSAIAAWVAARNQGQQPVLQPDAVADIALEFAQAHFPQFASRGMQRVYTEASGATCCTVVANGGRFAGNQCVVHVSEFTGDVLDYFAVETGTVAIPIIPGLSAQQAEGAALASYQGDPNVASVFTIAPSELWITVDPLGQQRLVWMVPAATSAEQGYDFVRWTADDHLGAGAVDIVVDANTGTIVSRDAFLGDSGRAVPSKGWHSRTGLVQERRQRQRAVSGPVRVILGKREAPGLAFLPVVRGRTMYWYAAYLRHIPWRMTVARKGATVQIGLPDGGRAELRDGEPRLIVNAHALPLAHPPLLLMGRTYLPVEVWERLTGWRFRWSASERVLRIDTGPSTVGPGHPRRTRTGP